MAKSFRRGETRNIVLASILSALVIVMTVVPYTGYISYGLIEITTLHIVTILAGVLLGWKLGATVGAVWGATCIVRCLVAMPVYKMFGFANIFVAFLPRVCVGIVSGLVFSGLKKTHLSRTFSIGISAIAGSLTNTVLVLSAMTVYCKTNNVSGYETAGVFSTIQSIVATLSGLNGVLELIAAILIVPAIYAVLSPRKAVLGIDFGASTTKLALVQRNRCVRAIRMTDGETLQEAIERLGVSTVSRVAVTGVGAASFKDKILGLDPVHVDEFTALSKGASACSRKHNCLVVSVGTGTSFVRVTPFFSRHVGGSGLGGGTLKGLASRLSGTEDMDAFRAMAQQGDAWQVDLQIRDVCEGTVPDLQPTSTVANLAKLDSGDLPNDIAAGICNMIFESIGVMAAFAVHCCLTRTIVLVGTITDWPVARKSLDEVAALHHVSFIVPDRAPYATAIGAAMEE